MKHPDYDRAFHQTPDYIRSAIELGFMKGKKRMRARRRVAGALTAAAALVLLLGAGIYGASRLAANRPDDRIGATPLSAGGQFSGAPLRAGGRGEAVPNPEPAITATPEATAAPTRSEASAEEASNTSESTPAPEALDAQAEDGEGARSPAEEVAVARTPEVPTPGVDPAPSPTAFDSASEAGESAAEAALQLAEGIAPESTPTPGVDPTVDDPLARGALIAATPEPTPPTAPAPGVDPTSVPDAPLVYLSAFVDEGADPFFHVDRSCGGREPLSVEMDFSTALWQRFTPCPDCVDGRGYRLLVFRADGTGDVAIRYALWYTASGNYCHVDSNCSGMAGAQEHGIAEAFANGKYSCPVCMENWTCAVALDAPGNESALIDALGGATVESLPEGASIAVEPANDLPEGASIAVEPAPTAEVYESVEVAPAAEAALDAVYYAEQGSYFHGEADCAVLRSEESGDRPAESSGGSGVVVIAGSLMDALRAGKDACPNCLSGWDFVVSAVPSNAEAMEVEAVRAESIEAEIASVYAAAGEAGLYHRSDSCGDAALPRELSVEQALREGLNPCPDCLPASACTPIAYFEADGSRVSAEGLWYTEGGNYFHSSMYCDGMRGAAVHPIADAFASGKGACPRCMDGWTFALRCAAEGASAATEPARFAMAEATPAPVVEYGVDAGDGAEIAATAEDGRIAASGAAASDGSAELGSATGIAAAPSDGEPYDVSHRFYYTPNGRYYHMRSDCSGMTGAKRHSAAETAASGKRHCPVCIGDRIDYYWLPAPQEDGNYDVPKLYDAAKDAWMRVVWSDAGNVFVPLNADEGLPHYYHVDPECFGMDGARMIPWDEAKANGLGPCPACLPVWNSGGSRTVCYVSEGDALYHADPNCAGVRHSRELTQLAAQAEGRLRCPQCPAGSAPAAWTEVRSELGASIADAYPGWSFERADEFEDRVEWFVSDGERAMCAAILYFAETARDSAEDPVRELVLQHGDTATRFFSRSFIESLPAPLSAIPSAANPGSIFSLRLEYEGGKLAAFTAGETIDRETSYATWTLHPNGNNAGSAGFHLLPR